MRELNPRNRWYLLAFLVFTLLQVNSVRAQYCPALVGNECDISAVKRFAMSNIDNNNGTCDEDILSGGVADGYSDYTAKVVYMKPGGYYQVTLEIYNGLITDVAAMWIDWNQDKEWTEDELTPLIGNDYTVGTYTAVVLVPPTALEDTIGRIRVISDFTTPPTDPCVETYSGEIEDYSFIVTEADPPVIPGSGPSYCPPLVGNECTEDAIKRFAVADLDNDNNVCDKEINTTGVADGYSDYTEMIATFNPTTPYPVTVEIYSSLILDAAAMWIDWNVDGSWSQDEYTPLVGNGYTVNMFVGVVTPPPGAVTGKVGRIRVIGDFTLTPTDPCVETFAGEIEDYSFILLPTGEEIPDCVDMSKALPADSADNQCQHLTLRWPKIANATGYKLTLRDTTDNVFIVSELLLTDTSYTIPAPLIPGHTYRWIPMAMNGDIEGFMCDSAIFTTSPNTDPTASIFLGTDSVSTCLGAPIVLDGGPNDGTAPYSDLWTGAFTSKLTSTTIVNPTFKADSVGMFTYFYQVTDDNGCKASDSVNLYVRKLPELGVLSSDKSGYCPGERPTIKLRGHQADVIQFQDSLLGTWTQLAGTNTDDSTLTDALIVFDTYVRAVLTLEGCMDTTENIFIDMYDLYQFADISNTGRDSICIGEKAQLVATNAAPYKWNDNSTNDSLLVSIPGIYRLSTTDTNGCVTTDSITIYANIEATKPSVFASPAAPYCVGDYVTLTATGANILWKDSTGIFSIPDSIGVIKNGSFVAQTTNAQGCSAKSDAYSVSFNPLPAKPTITDLSSTHCDGDSVGLRTNAVHPQWSTGQSSKTIYVNTDGLYTVTDTSAFGCATTSDTFNLVFDDLPVTPIVSQQGNRLECDSTGVKFRWYNSSGVQVAVTNVANWKPTKSGIYYVVAENSEGCVSSASTQVPFNGVGVGETIKADEWSVYPNPSSGTITLQTPISGKAFIYDATGRLLNELEISAGENKIQLELSAGIYQIRIGQSIQRISIQ